MSKLRNWFFEVTKTSIKKGTRLRKDDIPTQSTFKELTDSIIFKTESEDRAKLDTENFSEQTSGHVTLATDEQVIANTVQPSNRSLVVSPHQTTTLSNEGVNLSGLAGFTGRILERVLNTAITTRKDYYLTFSTAFKNWLTPRLIPSGGLEGQILRKNSSTDYNLIWSSISQAIDWSVNVTSITNVDAEVGLGYTAESIPIANITLPIGALDGTKIGISADNFSAVNVIYEGSSFDTVTSNQSVIYRFDSSKNTWLVESSHRPSIVTAQPNLYISTMSGNDITGDGSIIKPFKSLQKARSVVVSDQTVIAFGGNYLNNNGNLFSNPTHNLIKTGVKYTLFCFPGVTITTPSTGVLYDSSLVSGTLDIYGEPNIDCVNLASTCFIVGQICTLKLGSITSTNKIMDVHSKGTELSGGTSLRSVEISVDYMDYQSLSSCVKFMSPVFGSGQDLNGNINFFVKSLGYRPNFSQNNVNFIEINNPYSLTISGNLVHKGSGILTNPSLIKVTSIAFTEVSINKLTCRLGGAGVVGGTIIDLGALDLTSNKFLAKDVFVSLSACNFVKSSVASSIYAENIYLVLGSTVQSGSALIKTVTPSIANTRIFISTDVFIATPFNI